MKVISSTIRVSIEWKHNKIYFPGNFFHGAFFLGETVLEDFFSWKVYQLGVLKLQHTKS